MHKRTSATAVAASALIAACLQAAQPPQADAAPPPTLECAGQPINPLKAAGHITGARVGALVGNQDGGGAN